MSVPAPISAGPVTLSFDKPVFMGILNVTPDSFSDGGALPDPAAALRRATELVEAGARILDIGGESTRPGAEPVTADEELRRIVPVLQALARERLPAAVSVDTRRASVARAALDTGAHIVNDISALADPEMAATVASFDAALIVMHMRGEPRTMQQGDIVYTDLIGDIRDKLFDALEVAADAGVKRRRIMFDPGIGFGKTLEHNLSLTKHIGELALVGRPVVYGPSRKRFLGDVTGRPVHDRDRATAAACMAAVLGGAHVLRVHDVAACVDAVKLAVALRGTP